MNPRWVSFAQGFVGALLAVVGVAVPFAAQRVEEVPASVSLVLGLVLATTGTVVLVMAVRRWGAHSAIPLAVGTALAYLVITSLGYPAMEPQKSARAFALKLKQITATSRAQGHEVLAFDLENVPTAIAFYSDGVYTVTTNDSRVLETHLMQDSLVFAAVDATGLETLSDEVLQRVVVHHRTRLSRRDILLISNIEG